MWYNAYERSREVPKSLPLISPHGFQKYDCNGCSNCCRGRFGINLSQQDYERLLSQNWTCSELGIPEHSLVETKAGQHRLAHRPDGACVFLQDDGLCRIHAKLGEPAKPLGCRMYPFRLIPAGDEVRADMRFDCPPVARNEGRPVSGHAADLRGLLKIVAPDGTRIAPPPYFGSVTLPWKALARITDAFERLLGDVSLDLTRRVIACVNMSALLRDRRVALLEEPKLGDYLDALVGDMQEAALADPLSRREPQALERTALRHLAGVYGRIVLVSQRPRPLRLLATSLRMIGGSGALPPLRDELALATFEDIERPLGTPSGECASPIERHLLMHLTSMGFFGRGFYGRSYLDGLGALLITYPLTCWFARAIAASEGMETLTKDACERAIMIVDHQHANAPLLDSFAVRALSRYLSERAALRSLAIWYGT